MNGRNPRLLAAAALFAAFSGCQTPSPRVKPPEAAPPAAVPAPLDPSFDWHVLLVAPFGSVLKDIPLALHEVLLFRDQDSGAGTSEDGECYAADVGAPRFLASAPDEYLLCFKRDRLTRIHATVRLPDSEAPALFAAACAGWLKTATSVAASAATSAATSVAASAAAAAGATDSQASAAPGAVQSAVVCEGRDGVGHFNAGFEEQPEASISITLDSALDP
jgi:hypothetical protein